MVGKKCPDILIVSIIFPVDYTVYKCSYNKVRKPENRVMVLYAIVTTREIFYLPLIVTKLELWIILKILNESNYLVSGK